MRKIGIIAVLSLMALALAAVPAFAGSPHFIKNATKATLSGSTLNVSFKEAGLPSGSTETVTVSADALTTYECVNGGGRNPSASNKTTTQSEVSNSGEFTADKNGNIVGTLSLSPPTATQLGFSCPPGQTVTFVSVTYTNVAITDEDSGASTTFPGSFSFTNPSAP
jgi:type II secretory pathway pseudopilin PulG